jgi:transposase
LGRSRVFPNSRTLISYLGLNPGGRSSGRRQRFGHISKQDHEMLRWMLVEASQTAARWHPDLRRKYQRLKFRRGRNVAKVALARHLAVRLSWALRQMNHTPLPVRMPSSPVQPVLEATPPTH